MITVDFQLILSKVLGAFGTILSDTPGLIVFAVIIICLTYIVSKRNHLTKQRTWSNILQIFMLLVGWLILKAYYMPSLFFDEDVLVSTAFTVLLGFVWMLSTLLAYLVRTYAPAPFSILRGQIAAVLIRLADRVVDHKYGTEQLTKKEQIQKSINVITDVLNARKAD